MIFRNNKKIKPDGKKLFLLCTALILIYIPNTAPAALANEVASKSLGKNSKGQTIIVEAILVEAELSALYESTDEPVTESPNSVTLPKLLWCLRNENNGKVLANTKLTIQQEKEARVGFNQRQYAPIKKQVTGKDQEYYMTEYQWLEENVEFAATASVQTDEKITLNFLFKYATPEQPRNTNSEDTFESHYTSKSSITLSKKQPEIISMARLSRTAVFLVLCADVQ